MNSCPECKSEAFYREVYHVDTKTGQRSLYDYDFLDAQLENSAEKF